MRIRSEPHREVFVLEKVTKGNLTLVPSTLRVSIGDDDKAMRSGGVCCSVEAADGATTNVFLLPMITKDFVAPFWARRVTDNQEDANVRLSKVQIKITIGDDQVTNVNLQVAINPKTLRREDALVLYRPLTQSAVENIAQKRKSIEIKPEFDTAHAKAVKLS